VWAIASVRSAKTIQAVCQLSESPSLIVAAAANTSPTSAPRRYAVPNVSSSWNWNDSFVKYESIGGVSCLLSSVATHRGPLLAGCRP
jgi:hypothetical protein